MDLREVFKLSPTQELRNNPITTILLALLIGTLTYVGSSMNTSFAQLWQKLDRVTALMAQERDSIRAELRDGQKLLLCHDREIGEIKERMAAHLREYDREITNNRKKQ